MSEPSNEQYRAEWYSKDARVMQAVRAIATRAAENRVISYVFETDWEDFLQYYTPTGELLLGKEALGLHVPTLMDLVKEQLNTVTK